MKFIKIVGLGLCCLSALAQAGIVLYPTRLVLTPQDQRGVLVTIKNTDKGAAYLMQSYVSADTEPYQGKSSAYFQVIPPLTRVNEADEAIVRVLPTPGLLSLPQDRESLFYFSSRAIPNLSPLARNPQERHLGGGISMLVTMRIKVFYRPALAMTQAAAFSHLQFSRLPGVIVVKNPSPYYVTLDQLRFDNIPVKLHLDKNNLLPPYGEQRYAAHANATAARWVVINDDGSTSSYHSLIDG